MVAAFGVDAYLERIDYRGSTQATIETLRDLHRAHLLAVPFENLDIHLGREIVLDEGRLVAKIVGERRGGFCYELNGAFAELLREMGFAVTLLSAGVSRGDGSFGPEFDHMLLRVDLDEPWLADVGFGDCFQEPIRLSDDAQPDGGRMFRLVQDGEYRVLERHDGEIWSAQYRFTLTPRELADFAAMCRFHQTSPDTHFTQSRVCSRSTQDGRISLAADRLIVTEHGQRRELPIDGDAEYAVALRNFFGVVLPS